MSVPSFSSSSSSLCRRHGDAMQIHLQRALEEMGRRQEVHDCLTEMITNVEWAAHCNQTLQHQSTQDALERVQHQQATVWAESALVQLQEKETRTALADSFVHELYQVSQKLGELYQLKQDHLELSQNYDAIVAQLLQAEERIQFMKEGGRSNADEDDQTNNTSAKESGVFEKQKEPTKAVQGMAEPEAPTPLQAATADSGASVASTGTATTIPTVVLPPAATRAAPAGTVVALPPLAAPVSLERPAVSLETNPQATTMQTSTHKTQPSHPVVSIDTEPSTETSALLSEKRQAETTIASPVVMVVDENEQEQPRLETLETQVLMHIFSYLDALDILNAAQVNISMYSRVDNLFGLGDGAAEGDNSTIATAESAPPPPAPTKLDPASKQTQATVVSLPPAPVSSTTDAPSAPAPTTTTRATSLPLTPKQGQAASALASGGSGAPLPSIQGFDRNLFGFLQPRKSPVLSPPSATTTSATPSRKSHRPPEPAPMNAAMANSMAAKLTDAELNAIIHMTERLRTKEQQLEQLRDERERLLAQLDGVDAVKQFLVAKVRSMEESLRKTEDQEAKVAQQIASDQEVIAFLDGRVQELEQTLERSKDEISKLKQEWLAYQTQAEQKATVLADMLRFERERVQETVTEYKTTKKLLVKEVKSCRAQIMALTAQNKAVSQENETLKRALLLSSHAPSSPPAAKYSHARSATASAISS